MKILVMKMKMFFNSNIISRLSILYVEDSRTTKESISILFNNKFKKIFLANDGEEALSLLYFLYHHNKCHHKILLKKLLRLYTSKSNHLQEGIQSK
jgi:hypothetical protein